MIKNQKRKRQRGDGMEWDKAAQWDDGWDEGREKMRERGFRFRMPPFFHDDISFFLFFSFRNT